MTDQPEILRFDTPAAFRDWLREHQDSSAGLWLTVAKKASQVVNVTYDEALDVALEYGWIDGQTRRLDDEASLRRFTPRRAQSPWSLRNCRAAEAMIEQGRMAPRGRAEVERAKGNGRWDRAYEGSSTAEPHPDFLAALEQNAAAREFYATLNSQNRFAIYYRIQSVKREETRTRKIKTFVEMLARGEKFHD
ncbi:MAG: hypothetical protein JWO18_2061 [Microbacteriaceae bacterium]|nr:hypothetical protein [Microbacteriaceae bacterium]